MGLGNETEGKNEKTCPTLSARNRAGKDVVLTGWWYEPKGRAARRGLTRVAIVLSKSLEVPFSSTADSIAILPGPPARVGWGLRRRGASAQQGEESITCCCQLLRSRRTLRCGRFRRQRNCLSRTASSASCRTRRCSALRHRPRDMHSCGRNCWPL